MFYFPIYHIISVKYYEYTAAERPAISRACGTQTSEKRTSWGRRRRLHGVVRQQPHQQGAIGSADGLSAITPSGGRLRAKG
jgi:hypothetical protein